MKSLAFATHVALIDGKEYEAIGDLIVETLADTEVNYYMVRHSMDGGLRSQVRGYRSGKQQSVQNLGALRHPGPLRYVSELLSTVWYFSFQQRVDVFVGIDPLNALAAVLLRKFSRVGYCVFYTPDYSERRFGSNLLNRVYHAIDRYCVKHADEVWSVSPKIQQVRRDMGLAEAKNVLIPNVPPAKFDYLRSHRHDKYALVSSGIVDTQLDNEGTIRALAELLPRHPKLTFTIIGNGPDELRLKKLVRQLKLEKHVTFTGRKPLAETFDIYSHCGIGLALYTGEWGFNAYGDSSKCRQCFYLGLPVISTDTHATVPEIVEYRAGVIVQKDVASYVAAIESVLSNYDTYTKASTRLGNRYLDIHKKNLLRLLANQT